MAARERNDLKEWWIQHKNNNSSSILKENRRIISLFFDSLDLATVGFSQIFVSCDTSPDTPHECKNYLKYKFKPEIADYLASFALQSCPKTEDFQEFVHRYRYLKKGLIEQAFFRAKFAASTFQGFLPDEAEIEVTFSLSESAKDKIAFLNPIKGARTKKERREAIDSLLESATLFIQKHRNAAPKAETALMIQAAPLWVFLALNLPKSEHQKAWDYIVAAFITCFDERLLRSPDMWPHFHELLLESRKQFALNELHSPKGNRIKPLAKRDPGTEKYNSLLWIDKHNPSIYEPFSSLEERVSFDIRYSDPSSLVNSFKSLAVFQTILDSCKVYVSSATLAPLKINRSANILMFDHITSLIYLVNMSTFNLFFLDNPDVISLLTCDKGNFVCRSSCADDLSLFHKISNAIYHSFEYINNKSDIGSERPDIPDPFRDYIIQLLNLPKAPEPGDPIEMTDDG